MLLSVAVGCAVGLSVVLSGNIALAAGVATTDDIDRGKPLQLEAFLNGNPTGLIAGFTLFRDGHMAATRSELADIGIRAPGDGATTTLVTLENISGLRYRYDEPKQAIEIEATQSLLIGRDYAARRSQNEDLHLRKGFGAVLNYDLFTSSLSSVKNPDLKYQSASASLDARLFSPYGTVEQSGIVGSTLQRSANGLRLDTTYDYSDPDTLVSYKAGDTISSGLAWTRPIRLAGAQIQRNFSLRPDLVTLPLPVISGNAAVPSTLDVFINNVKTYSQEIAPGAYRVTDLPVSGGGSAHVVIHDSTGRQSEQDLQFFASKLLMRPGFSDYSAEVGLPRRNYGSQSNDYSREPVASASLRHGLFDWLTLEAHTEDSAHLANLGAGGVARVFDRALVSAAIAGSKSLYGAGVQLYGSFETQLRGVTVNLSSQRVIGTYDDLASTTASGTVRLNGVSVANSSGLDSFAFLTSTRPPRSLDRASFGVPVPFDKSTISASFTRAINADGSRSVIGSINWSRSIPLDGAIFVTAFTNIGSKRQSGVYAGLTIPLGPKINASTGVTVGSGQKTIGTDVSKSLELEQGSYGWRLHDLESAQSSNAQRSAAASYRAPWARVEVGATEQHGSATGTLQASGSLATLGNGIYAANRIDDAFAVVDAAGPNVPVYYENRMVGHTDSSGRLLVPYLRSYQRNDIRIDTTNLPVNADAVSTRDVVVPAYRNGVRVDFGVKTDVAGAIVILTGPDGKYLKVGTQGYLEGSGEKFVVGYDGRAYLKGLAAHNILHVGVDFGECRVSFDYQPSKERQVVVGPVACR